MTTAVETKLKRDKAWLRRSGEAHVLAAAIFEHYRKTGEFGERFSLQKPAGADFKASFLKMLILEWAARLGFPVGSRKDLTAEQIGHLCTALRARMQELGIPEPEQTRPPEAATTSDWKQLTKLFDDVERARGWTPAHRLNFVKRQIGRRSLRHLTHGEAQAVIRGLDGVLRHGSTHDH